MRQLIIQIVCMAGVILCAAHSPLSEDTLKNLSAAGEQYVDEEIKQTMLGVKQMKEIMEKREEKHKHLMDALRHSRDKKRGAMQLTKESEQKLEEAEQQCQDLARSSLRECRPCLEDTCKAFYTSTCRRGFSSFSFKVEEFFRKMAAQLDATEHVFSQNQNSDRTTSAENQVAEDNTDLELLQAESSFSQLLSNISLLYNHSIILVRRMQQVYDHSFLPSFISELQPSSHSAMQGELRAGFFKTLGFGHIFHSAYDFGKGMLEEFSSTVADVFGETQEAEENFQQSSRDASSLTAYGQPQSEYLCRRLRRQTSECWQLKDVCETCKGFVIKECPHLQQLQSEMDEMHTLLNASSQQYNQRLQLVQRHTADTQRWLSNVQDKYGWVSQQANITMDTNNIFSVITVNLQQQMKNHKLIEEHRVVVSILGSAPITIPVPKDLVVEDPAFIQYVAQEALTLYKQQIKGMK
ncbi:clusterin-like protein 1 [Melanotaenia boesemani]|uniref:clusterin-like protein 1 n=1 Tax=Melanotaenia boesemani TaxID=1250792 RepID=UPI001C046BD2|nr:clusterin-like protein 1 [Melanotaenia boesemani]